MRRRQHVADLAIALCLFAVLAAVVSWPLLRDFSTRFLGDVWFDQRQAIWRLWQVKEALLGRQPFATTDLLYYPHGASVLIFGVGPLSGLFALPFWPWGPVAAYNGAMLVGLTLSGWCMYVLARFGGATDSVSSSATGSATDSATGGAPSSVTDSPSLFARRAAAGLAGVVYMLFPIHLAALYGHVEKLFSGLLPLSVLAALFAYDPRRSRAWLGAPGIVLLLALLHHGNQFMFALLASVLLAMLGAIAWHPRAPRRVRIHWPVVRRACAAGGLALAIVGPMLVPMARVARDPSVHSVVAAASLHHQPDLLQLVVPSIHQATVGRLFYPRYEVTKVDFTRESIVPSLNAAEHWQGSGIETAVTIPVSVLALAIVAWATRRSWRAAGDAGLSLSSWILFSATFVVLSLGPILRVMGRTTFTLYRLPVVLPYAVLTSRPGFDVMRTPGRFMMIASVGLALLAAWGLAALMARAPRRAALVAVVAMTAVAVECWPRAWLQHVPPPVPAFYRQIAQDPERYGVLDLPGGDLPPDASSAYMYYQLTHNKGIAWAYLSRQRLRHPIEGLDAISGGVYVDAQKAADEGHNDQTIAVARATRDRLAALGYRYVVWHKHHFELFWSRRPDQVAVGDATPGGFRDPPMEAGTYPFIRDAFAGEAPIVDDDLVTVYRVRP